VPIFTGSKEGVALLEHVEEEDPRENRLIRVYLENGH